MEVVQRIKKMKAVAMTEIRCKEEDEDMQQKAPNPQQQLNSKPVSVPNFNMVVLPAQNQVIDAMGNKYFFVDSSGNPVSPVLQVVYFILFLSTCIGQAYWLKKNHRSNKYNEDYLKNRSLFLSDKLQ